MQSITQDQKVTLMTNYPKFPAVDRKYVRGHVSFLDHIEGMDADEDEIAEEQIVYPSVSTELDELEA
jgi:hypothetical protein